MLAGVKPETDPSELIQQGSTGRAAGQAAKAMETNEWYVYQVKEIKEKKPEAIQEIESGDRSAQFAIEIRR